MKRTPAPTISTILSAATFGAVCCLLPLDLRATFVATAVGAMPANCVEHTSFGAGNDFDGDYRCAGVAIDYHTAGVSFSPGVIWAGQWLFLDDADAYRLGTCTFNRGSHPRADRPSTLVEQTFVNDVSGAKRAYLTWRYGETTDNLTAAALWAVFHFYAQDSAGTRRAFRPDDPLIASLDRIGENSGRQDIEDLAIAFDAEARRLGGSFVLSVVVVSTLKGVVTLTSGDQPVAGVSVRLNVAGGSFSDGSSSITGVTDQSGQISFELNDVSNSVAVTATSSKPGLSQIYRGIAADPSGVQAQTQLTAGRPTPISAVASFDVPVPPPSTLPTTTEPATTVPVTTVASTVAETTTTIETTTTSTTTPTTSTTTPTTTTTTAPTTGAPPTTPPTSTSVDSTIAAPSTTMPSISTPSSATTLEPSPPAVFPPVFDDTPPPPPPVPIGLPSTGSSYSIGYLGTALVVAGIGLIGTVRRKREKGTDSASGTAETDPPTWLW